MSVFNPEKTKAEILELKRLRDHFSRCLENSRNHFEQQINDFVGAIDKIKKDLEAEKNCFSVNLENLFDSFEEKIIEEAQDDHTAASWIFDISTREAMEEIHAKNNSANTRGTGQ